MSKSKTRLLHLFHFSCRFAMSGIALICSVMYDGLMESSYGTTKQILVLYEHWSVIFWVRHFCHMCQLPPCHTWLKPVMCGKRRDLLLGHVPYPTIWKVNQTQYNLIQAMCPNRQLCITLHFYFINGKENTSHQHKTTMSIRSDDKYHMMN